LIVRGQEFHADGLVYAGLDTEAAHNTFAGVEDHHVVGVQGKGPCGAYAHAGTAVDAAIFVSYDVAVEIVDRNPRSLHKIYRLADVLFFAHDFHHQEPLFFGGDVGLQDVEVQVVLLHHHGGDRFVHHLFGEFEYHFCRCHISSP